MISENLLRWYSLNKRPLPWRETTDPYKIWISEIMLQQTQVSTVIPYYNKWIKEFPNIHTLSKARYDYVLKLWEGLGYYSRCKNIHKTSKILRKNFPDNYEKLIQLPGVGDYTAKTILAIAFNQNQVGIDTNLERISFRLLGLKKKSKLNKNKARKFLERIQDKKNPGDFNQALMDLGSSICQSSFVNCQLCPISDYCKAFSSSNPINYPEKKKTKPIPTLKVSTCIVRKRNKLLILQRPFDKMLGGLWEFPGGKIKNNELKEEAAIREVMEETGLPIKPDYLGQVSHQYSHFKVWISLFLSDINDDSLLETKQKYQWVTRDELNDFALPKANYKMLEILDKLE
ncbi:MAG: A/G-specific adenine glycosylase [Candidatus Neomarinimicrobiota bacterium]|nr:A/G-specific adenine glycosylase [Candidatus Neomarinimicrobiota bacterium]